MKDRLAPRRVLLLALAVSLLSLVPSLEARWAASPPERVFMGFPFMAVDHYQYASFIRQASEEGRFFMQNLFTSEPQRGVYIMLYYWLLGTFSRLTGLSVMGVWRIFQVLGGFLYVLMFWKFAGSYFEDRKRRIFVVVLFSCGGGVEWMVTLVRATVLPGASVLEYPYDYYWNWATFGTMFVPNWIWPALLLMLSLHLVLKRSRGWMPATFVILPVVWFLHHHSAMVAYLIFGFLPFIPLVVSAARQQPLAWDRARANLHKALPALLSFPVVAAYLLWARTDLVFRLNASASFQWKIFFSPWWYPLAYGLLLPLAFFGLKRTVRERSDAAEVLLAWLSAAFLLAINPLEGGAKYQFLMFPPLVILAARGLDALRDESAEVRRLSRKPVLVAAALVLLFLDAPVSLVKSHGTVQDERDAYYSTAEITAMRWLGSQPPGIVLCSYGSGHLIPWLSGHKVYVGHWFMTLDLARKNREVSYFFAPQAPARLKREILRKVGARYVFQGPAERRLGSVDDTLPLDLIHEEGPVKIYRVRDVR